MLARAGSRGVESTLSALPILEGNGRNSVATIIVELEY